MTTRKRTNKNKFSFSEIWERVRRETPLENFTQLAEIVETAASNITKRKNEDIFPVEWAFWIGEKYGISTEWILTGKRRKTARSVDPFFSELEEWAKEVSESENLKWLENQIENQFPDFKRWREEKTQPSKTTADYPSSKVA